MRIIKNLCGSILPILLLMTLFQFEGPDPVLAENPKLSTAVFFVQ